jgi:cytochrome c5
MNPASILKIACSVASLLVLASCDGKGPAPLTAEQVARLRPADHRLAELYQHSCKSCHTKSDSGAPQVRNRRDWDTRWATGLPTLVDHTIVGFQAMPAGGQCTACTRKDFEDLIRFMADREQEK